MSNQYYIKNPALSIILKDIRSRNDYANGVINNDLDFEKIYYPVIINEFDGQTYYVPVNDQRQIINRMLDKIFLSPSIRGHKDFPKLITMNKVGGYELKGFELWCGSFIKVSDFSITKYDKTTIFPVVSSLNQVITDYEERITHEYFELHLSHKVEEWHDSTRVEIREVDREVFKEVIPFWAMACAGSIGFFTAMLLMQIGIALGWQP